MMGSSKVAVVVGLTGVLSFVSRFDQATAERVGAGVVDIPPIYADMVPYRVHGLLMWMSFGILLPSGILISKYAHGLSRPIWFHLHWVLQVIGVIVATASFFIGCTKLHGRSSRHAKIGIFVCSLIWLQLLLGICRPRKKSLMKPYWYVLHWLFGTAAVILGWLNIYRGFCLYDSKFSSKDSLQAAVYSLFYAQIGTIAFIYLFLDRWPYIIQQMNQSYQDRQQGNNTTAAVAPCSPCHELYLHPTLKPMTPTKDPHAPLGKDNKKSPPAHVNFEDSVAINMDSLDDIYNRPNKLYHKPDDSFPNHYYDNQQ